MNTNQNNDFLKGILIGVGCGIAVGGTVGYFAGKSRTERRARERIEKAREKAYLRGQEDATAEAKKWIDENILIVDPTDEDCVRKAINEHMAAMDTDRDDIQEGTQKLSEPIITVTEGESMPDPSNGPERENGALEGQREAYSADDDVLFSNGLKYPKKLFFAADGNELSTAEKRANLISYEKSPEKLRLMWRIFGWGEYYPDNDGVPTAEEINNWDLDIDGKPIEDADEERQYGDEPLKKTIERSLYLDEIDRYMAHPEDAPRIISRKEFDDECYLEKRYIDWYEGDNVFVENNDMDREVDAFNLLGVVNGKDLFEHRNDIDPDGDDYDPDIVHIKNFKMNSVLEVTRFHLSYASVRSGGAYVHGDTDYSGGTEGL